MISKNIKSILTRVLVFSFFLSGVKIMAGSIKSKDLAGGIRLTGTDLGLSGGNLEFSDGNLWFSNGNFIFFGRDLEFFVDFRCFPLIFLLDTQIFNCLMHKKIIIIIRNSKKNKLKYKINFNCT